MANFETPKKLLTTALLGAGLAAGHLDAEAAQIGIKIGRDGVQLKGPNLNPFKRDRGQQQPGNVAPPVVAPPITNSSPAVVSQPTNQVAVPPPANTVPVPDARQEQIKSLMADPSLVGELRYMERKHGPAAIGAAQEVMKLYLDKAKDSKSPTAADVDATLAAYIYTDPTSKAQFKLNIDGARAAKEIATGALMTMYGLAKDYSLDLNGYALVDAPAPDGKGSVKVLGPKKG